MLSFVHMLALTVRGRLNLCVCIQEYMQFGQKARNFYVAHGLMSKAADQVDELKKRMPV